MKSNHLLKQVFDAQKERGGSGMEIAYIINNWMTSSSTSASKASDRQTLSVKFRDPSLAFQPPQTITVKGNDGIDKNVRVERKLKVKLRPRPDGKATKTPSEGTPFESSAPA